MLMSPRQEIKTIVRVVTNRAPRNQQISGADLIFDLAGPAHPLHILFPCLERSSLLVVPHLFPLHQSQSFPTLPVVTMSRNADKKPVGFATHLTAGGIAGACEAVRAPSVKDMLVLTHQCAANMSAS